MKKQIYSKQAKSLDEQVDILRNRGIIISDTEKAKEYLSDIGYYRLGFYSYLFEITYPELGNNRRHDVKAGTTIEDIVALYYYDFDLRTILNKYLSRIEVSIRTTIIYKLSLKYMTDPNWFVNKKIVTESFKKSFYREVYHHIETRPTIVRHHKKYSGKYAPAWKTIEYMTLGNLEILYDNLLLDIDKRIISTTYKEPAIATFKTYLSAIREVRNACAHGNVIYGLRLINGIHTGVACPSFSGQSQQTLNGALRVINHMIKQISVNRANDMAKELNDATKRLYSKVPSIRSTIETETGIIAF